MKQKNQHHPWLSGLVLCAAFTSHAFGQALVSESEARIYGTELAPASTATIESPPNAPTILVVKPDVEHLQQSPVALQLLVIPADGAQIAWESVKLSYGSLRFNITDRFLKIAKRTQSGFKVEHLEVPNGTHRLLFRIRDSKNRWGSREFVLRIAGTTSP